MLLGVVLVVVALMGVVDVFAGVVFVVVAFVDVVDVARLVAVMLVVVALVDVMDMLASVMLVVVAFVDVVLCSHHSYLLVIFPITGRKPEYLTSLGCLKSAGLSSPFDRISYPIQGNPFLVLCLI